MNVTVSINREYNLASDTMANFKNKTGLDLSFQSEERWDINQKSRYATSLVTGMAPSKIIVTNIENCIEPMAEGTDDYNYFQSWLDQGKKYISIDGNNRTQTIDAYLRGEVPLIHGQYNLPDGTVTIGEHNDRYINHPKVLKDHIEKNIRVSICEYIVANREDLSNLFININNGVALNPQELRNARLVPFANEIRKLAKEYTVAFEYIFKNNNRRNIDEQLVNMAVYYAFGASNGISKKNKDDAYDDNSYVWQQFQVKGKKVIQQALKIVSKNLDISFREVSTMMNFFIAVCACIKSDRKILDEQEFYKWFMRTENARIGNKEILWKDDKESRNYVGCNTSTSPQFLTARYDAILKDLNNISTTIVSALDPERLFTKGQRYEMWLRQEGKCPATGKVILEEDINNHDLWAADHIIPYSKGGQTTIDNGQLVCKQYNLKKSDKMMELAA